MKSMLLLAALVFASNAYADEPETSTGTSTSTSTSTTSDEAGTPGENAPPAPDQPAPDKSEKPKARLATPRPHIIERVRPKDDGDGKLDKKEDEVAGGKHWRIATAQGSVHVWVPDGYDRETAGTVIYVHGYYTDADGAWRDHELARQFKASHQNAMFIVPDAPAGNDDSVQWPA